MDQVTALRGALSLHLRNGFRGTLLLCNIASITPRLCGGCVINLATGSHVLLSNDYDEILEKYESAAEGEADD